MAHGKNEPGIIKLPGDKRAGKPDSALDKEKLPGTKWAGKPDIAFGKTLRKYRLRAHIEQEQLGRACGLSGNSISNWERGVSRPDISLVPTLCRLLDMPIYALFGMTDPDSYTGEEQALLSDYRIMTLPNRRQLRKIVDAILISQEETRAENYRQTRCRLLGHGNGLAAGFGGPLDEEPETFPVFVRMSHEACHADDVFPVNGHSMEPDYPDGSKVFVERVESSALHWGDVIACIAAGTPYVKIYEKDGLHSINPEYPVIHVTEDDNVHLIGRVLGLVPEDAIATKEETEELLEILGSDSK